MVIQAQEALKTNRQDQRKATPCYAIVKTLHTINQRSNIKIFKKTKHSLTYKGT